jgi:anti-sigma B factor antagonist
VAPEDDPSSRRYEIRLAGEVDLDHRAALRALVDDFESSDATDVTVDLSDVTFIDSAGVGGLVMLGRVAQARGGHVRLLRPVAAVRKVLAILGLESRFEIVDG